MSKHKAIMAVVSLLALPAISSAVLIGNFEGGLDGWSPSGANTLSNSATGVSLGSEAAVFTATGGGWGPTMSLDILGHADEAAILAAIAAPGSKLTADITGFGGAPENPGWWAQAALLVNAEGTWEAIGMQGLALNGTPTTYEWTFTGTAKTGIANGKALNTYAQVAILTNGGTPTTLHVDNIQIIPEPATIGLVAVFGGGMLFIRRRLKV